MGATTDMMIERANEILANRQDDSDTDDEDEEHQEQMEAHGYDQCSRCYIELHQDDLGVCDDGYICIGCNNEVEMEREEQWNNRTCIGRNGDDCGSPCNSSSAEFCDDCLAQEIGYCY
tara:strand:- start:782 stop:1135 length:354 start_codon:yes stop_codon:yes gene_type:complete